MNPVALAGCVVQARGARRRDAMIAADTCAAFSVVLPQLPQLYAQTIPGLFRVRDGMTAPDPSDTEFVLSQLQQLHVWPWCVVSCFLDFPLGLCQPPQLRGARSVAGLSGSGAGDRVIPVGPVLSGIEFVLSETEVLLFVESQSIAVLRCGFLYGALTTQDVAWRFGGLHLTLARAAGDVRMTWP